MATPTLTLSRLQSSAGPRTIPSTRAGNVTWIAFHAAQVSDGALTYVGISTFGPSIEANPLLAWLIAATGLGSAILGAKAARARVRHPAAPSKACTALQPRSPLSTQALPCGSGSRCSGPAFFSGIFQVVLPG